MIGFYAAGALVGGSPSASYSGLVLTSAPVAYHRLDTHVGGVFPSGLDDGNDLTISGTYTSDITPAPGLDGKAVRFNSCGGDFDSTSSLPTSGASGYAVEFLVKLFSGESPSNGYIFSRANTCDVVFNYGGANRIGIFKNVGSGGNVASNAFGPTISRDDEWHHVVIGYNPTSSRYEAWIDGALDSIYSTTAPSVSSNAKWGRSTSNVAPFAGGLDELAIYDRWLTNSEIESHAASALESGG